MRKIYFLLVICFGFAAQAQIVNIPDANFKAKLLLASTSNPIASTQAPNAVGSFTTYNTIDTNGDGEIQQSEAIQIKCLNLYSSTISNLTGIEAFTQLQSLWCNQNQLTQLDVVNLNNLKFFNCSNNQLTSLNVVGLNNLQRFWCNNNQLSSLSLIGLTNLDIFVCRYNQLTTLEFPNSFNLNSVDCSYNPPLSTIFIKDGRIFNSFEFVSNPNLEYICADENEIVSIQNKIATYGYTNCQVNSYCNFSPGGTTYTIQGQHRWDTNGNGCDTNDYLFPNMKFNISSGANSTTLISGNDGSFTYDVSAGTYTITPINQNPSYFSISPASATVTFPTSASPFNQNFCVTSNVGADLIVTILPLNLARPGFDNLYKIIYKNIGGIPLSGTVNFTFNDAINDVEESAPVFESQSGNTLSWTFSNLFPFQSRGIFLILNLNSPAENPPVNGGDVQNFTASVSGAFTDLTPSNNIFSYNQTIVNSYDPNDKTCLEGTTITPDKVGEYVHYVIRFENTGTANAQNVVVKDLIDAMKFDISTLIPIDGSHEFITRITNTNQVEFIFENIQLPFDDANNDGYVAFKIKTKPTLVEGNTFSNTANIYFDYNFPIITNTATTTIQALSNPDFEFSEYLQLAPNPLSDSLNIFVKEAIEVSSISIYNAMGQLILVVPNAQQTTSIDVSQLTSGTYFIKVISDKGSSNSKFIKQ